MAEQIVVVQAATRSHMLKTLATDHDQQFHEVIVDLARATTDNEDIFSPHRHTNLHPNATSFNCQETSQSCKNHSHKMKKHLSRAADVPSSHSYPVSWLANLATWQGSSGRPSHLDIFSARALLACPEQTIVTRVHWLAREGILRRDLNRWPVKQH
jgi:hypothetical protein